MDPRPRHDPGVPTGTVLAISLMTGTLMSRPRRGVGGGLGAAAALGAVRVRGTFAWVTRSRTAALVVGWFRDRVVRRTSLGAGLQMVANGMVQVTVPAWLITTGIMTGGPAGAVLMAMTLTMAAMGPLTGRASGVPFERWLRRGLLVRRRARRPGRGHGAPGGSSSRRSSSWAWAPAPCFRRP
jgi:hypothetical protein